MKRRKVRRNPAGPVLKVIHSDKYKVIVEPSVQEVPTIHCVHRD